VGFLTDLVTQIRADLDRATPDRDALEHAAGAQPPARDLATALSARPGVAVIAEVKRGSPSAGEIRGDADPATQAAAYVRGGAVAVSVLTQPRHFGGSVDDLRAVRIAVGVPVLRKDFIVRSEQVLEARAAGADTVLLIASCLDDGELAALLAAARQLGMEPLVETHGDADLERVLRTDARVVGVNSRNLETLDVDLDAALARVRTLPDDRIVVLESGVATRAHVEAAMAAGASAVLVGEALMRADDPASAVRELLGTVAAGTADEPGADRALTATSPDTAGRTR
jgi:indole-3-glycerol phosphate synthase